MSLKTAKLFALFLFIVAGIISTRNFDLFIGYLIFTFFALSYSIPPINFEKRGFLGPLSLVLVTIIIPSIIGMAQATPENPTMILGALLSLAAMTFGILLLKDFKDIKGDKKESKKTVVILLGQKKTLLISKYFSFMFLISTTILFYFIKANLFVLLIGFLLTFLLLSKELLTKKTSDLTSLLAAERVFSKTRIALFIYCIFILISVYFKL